MKRALIRVLIKTMVKGFYQAHTGLLLSLFILIFINFFYTPVLNQTHLTQEQIIRNALKLVLTTVSEPLGVLVLFSLWLVYSLKSGQYVARRLKAVDVQFLFYSSNAFSQANQLIAWSVVQLIIALPIAGLGVFAMIIGFAYGHWIIPGLIPFYLAALIVGNAFFYTHLITSTVSNTVDNNRLLGLRNWPKPLFSLFVYEVIHKKRVTYLVTKCISAISLVLMLSVFSDSHTDIRLFGLISLCIALAHSLLLYESSVFESYSLRFARSFPISYWQRYGQQWCLYSLLLLPELLLLFTLSDWSEGLLCSLLATSLLLLFRAVLYPLGQRMDWYLRIVFGLFTVFLLIILFGLTEWLLVGALASSWGLNYCYYYSSLE
ncbi:hypothetical protein M0L20_25240 [Spirosoma sp. RP8]|uniref:ABC transporter permease n=1 Tax=Spirosoma liriopis TaxID=2937440 RepID=A0ABT0HSP8_9BACT|nr:hypothetical protein [Spirosoma liriopis]MCK8495201.1 hypothetical protein [Spirosoma liriopis]